MENNKALRAPRIYSFPNHSKGFEITSDSQNLYRLDPILFQQEFRAAKPVYQGETISEALEFLLCAC